MSYPVVTMDGFFGDLIGKVDWGTVFSGIPAAATAQGLASAFVPIAGSKPAVTNYGSYSAISFSPEQEERVAAWILMQLNREPGPVRVDAGGVALKVVTRKYWPWAAGILALGVGIGYMARVGR